MPLDRLQLHIDLPLLPPPVQLETRAALKQAINTNRVWAPCPSWLHRFPITRNNGQGKPFMPDVAW